MKKTNRFFSRLLSAVLAFTMAGSAITAYAESGYDAADDSIISAVDEQKESSGYSLPAITDLGSKTGLVESEGFEISDDLAEELLSQEQAGGFDMASSKLDDGYVHYSNYLYNLLNAKEKSFYNNLKKVCEGVLISSKNYTDYQTFSGDSTKYYYLSDASFEGLTATRAAQVRDYFYYSNPQYYFVDTAYVWNTSTSTMWLCLIPEFRTYSERQKAEDAIALYTSKWMPQVEKLESETDKEEFIYSSVANLVEYDYPALDDDDLLGYDQSMASGLLRKKTVCAGYAQLTAYYMNAAGLECFSVTGDFHQWNVVKLYDNWYELDVTWMDGTVWDYRWVNKSYDTFKKQDKESHTYVEPWSIASPKPPECLYDEVINSAPSVRVGEKEYRSVTDAIKFNPTGDVEFEIIGNTIESKLTFPATLDSAKITSVDGSVLMLGDAAITANCDLTLDCDVEAIKSTAKNITINGAAGTTVTIKRVDSPIPVVLSGKKGSAFVIDTGAEFSTSGGDNTNIVVNKGSVLVLDESKAKPAKLSGDGTVKISGASTVTVGELSVGSLILEQYMKTSGKTYSFLIPKLTVGTIGNTALTVNDPSGKPADISGMTVMYLSKNTEIADLEKYLTITNTASGQKLSAVQYAKEIRAEYLEALKLTIDGKAKNYSSFEKLFAAITANAKTKTNSDYIIDLNVDTSIAKMTLPSKAKSLTINGNSHVLTLNGVTSVSPKYAFTLKDINMISQKALTISSSSGDTVIDGVIFDGKSLSIKGGSNNSLTLGECSEIEVLSGFGNILIESSAVVTKTLTASNLELGSSALLKIGTGAAATVKKVLKGNKGASIWFDDGYKSFTISGSVEGDVIALGSEYALGDKVIFKSKLDLSDKFDVTGISPDVYGDYSYSLITVSGSVYLKAELIDVNGTKFAFWKDAINSINDKTKDYTIKLLYDVNLGAALTLPAKNKYASLTIDGGNNILTFTGTSLSLKDSVAMKNITLDPVKSVKVPISVNYTITVGKGLTLDLDNVYAYSVFTIKGAGTVIGEVDEVNIKS